MKLFMVSMSEARIYVIAANQSNAIYRAYNKVTNRINAKPSNESFQAWKTGIHSIEELYSISTDNSYINVF